MNKGNYTRKIFLQQTTLCSMAMILGEAAVFANIGKQQLKKIGLIVNVLEAELNNDWKDTLRKVSSTGYTHLEFENYYGSDAAYFKSFIKELGLKPLAGGSVMAKMSKEDELKIIIEEALKMEKKYLVCYWPWMDDGKGKKLDDFKKAGEDLDKIGDRCNREGIRFAFHNHDNEFVKVEGYKSGYEVILKETDPDKVCMLLDLYWCAKGGGDAVELLDGNPGRIEMFHVKDMDNTPDKLYTCPGYGVLDFKKIFAHAVKSGVKYYTVEVDRHPTPVQCVQDSYRYLKGLRF